MKKLTLMVLAILTIATITYAQTNNSNFRDGIVYFKLKNSAKTELPTYSQTTPNLEDFSTFPKLIEIIEIGNVSKLFKPFKTPTENVQNIYKIEFSNYQKVDKIIETLNSMKIVEFAEKAQILQTFSTPNDTELASQWFLDNIQAYDAWDLTQGDANVKIAIVDDANRITHTDLADNVWHNPMEIAGNDIDDDNNGYVDDVNGWDAADNDNDPEPPTDLGWLGEQAFTHGTHCSGLAAGVTNNGVGIASVSYNVSYIPIKTVTDGALIPLGIETPSEGVDYAIVAGADIISMSFGGEDMSAFGTLSTLIDAANDAGIICIAAAGNNGDGSGGMFGGTTNAINYPAGLDNVIAVAASDVNDQKTSFSQYGTWVDIMSPGKDMYSTLAHSTAYGNQDGTSMACPLTAGALALMKSYKPMATKDEIVTCLYEGADNVDALNPQFVDSIGHGRLNVYNSLICLDNITKINNKSDIKEQTIGLYPNPSRGFVNISIQTKEPTEIKILNTTGQVVQSIKVEKTKKNTIDTNGWAKGIYFVQAENKITSKLIVQ